jgi:3-methyladenine DNA glycosylase AlkD
MAAKQDKTMRRIEKLANHDIIDDLAAAANPERAESSAWFFKTGKGQYGEGDIFIGITVPEMRRIALRHKHLKLSALRRLLKSKIHEHRMAALEILVAQYESGDEAERQTIYNFYLQNTTGINNWDLVDTSAPYIVGVHLRKRSRAILRKLAKSPNIWERRIAIVSTFGLIRVGETGDTYNIARMLLSDNHDLIHKAVGWALREAGKQSPEQLVGFLKENFVALPRTALRYAIEKFSAEQRKRFLAGQFVWQSR